MDRPSRRGGGDRRSWTTASSCSSASSAIRCGASSSNCPPARSIPTNIPLDTAKRELREETGHQAKFWRHLGTMHPCIGYSDERIEIFWAHGLIYVGHQRDHGEFLDVVEMSIADAILAVRDGEITDGKTISALMWADKIESGAWAVPD
jgi:ADP-ribose pyrophosphatase